MVDAYSAHADMLFAYEIMVALNEDARIEDETGEPRYSSVERGALFGQAVIYYARATIVSGSRRRSDLAGRLAPEEQTMHKQIEEMRHQAFAHFDSKASYKGNDFAVEKPILVVGEKGSSLRTAIKRLVLNEQLYADVLHQVKAMLKILEEHISAKSIAAREALWQLLDQVPDLGKEINKLPFDAFAFFGDNTIARDFLTTDARVTQGQVQGDEAAILARH
ncbi:MAG: hypothetical protein KBA57_01690 [Sphingomonadaceae bacterium]|nr:hypothetical protein [Sphingomonadaceae bacterium]